jgi:hypothetical protein
MNINEFNIEKDFIAENVKQIDEHVLLKTYYRYWSNNTNLVNSNLLIVLLNRILETNKEGKLLESPLLEESNILYLKKM